MCYWGFAKALAWMSDRTSVISLARARSMNSHSIGQICINGFYILFLFFGENLVTTWYDARMLLTAWGWVRGFVTAKDRKTVCQPD